MNIECIHRLFLSESGKAGYQHDENQGGPAFREITECIH